MWVVPVCAQLSQWIRVKAALPSPRLKMPESDVAASPNITAAVVSGEERQEQRLSSGAFKGEDVVLFFCLSVPDVFDLLLLNLPAFLMKTLISVPDFMIFLEGNLLSPLNDLHSFWGFVSFPSLFSCCVCEEDDVKSSSAGVALLSLNLLKGSL